MQTEDQKNLLTKVRKLLALGESANAYEATAALAKAHAMMEQHGLTNTDAIASEVVFEEANDRRQLMSWDANLMHAVAKAFGTFVNRHWSAAKGHYVPVFIGTPVDAAVSAAAYKGLREQAWKYAVAECGVGKDFDIARKRWLLAYVVGLKESVVAAQKGPAVVAYLEKNKLKMKVRKVRLDREAYERGRAVRLDRNQMEAGAERLALR